MTKLFVVDLDGCITIPFVTPHWPSISWIRELNQLSQSNPDIPELSICTGRPFPYAEAVAQWLDVRQPIVFESGGGIYYPQKQQLEFSPDYYQHEQEVAEVRSCVKHLIREEFSEVMLEFSKQTDAGVIHSDVNVILRVFDKARSYVEENFPNFEVHHTEVSVNIILKSCNKAGGLRNLSKVTGIPLEEMAYIGDSGGDVPALEIAGRAFAPANAVDAVKSLKNVTVTKGKTSLGVLEAYQTLAGS